MCVYVYFFAKFLLFFVDLQLSGMKTPLRYKFLFPQTLNIYTGKGLNTLLPHNQKTQFKYFASQLI